FWQGVFTPGIAVVVPAYINEEWEQGIGTAMGSYVSGTVIGGFLGRIVAGFVAARFTWRVVFAVLGLIGVAGGLAVWAWLPSGRRFRRAASAASTLRAMWRHLKNPRLIAT